MKIIIIGAGGHGKVVADAVLKEGKYELAGFADDIKSVGESVYLNHIVLCKPDEVEMLKFASGFILAIGNNKIRGDKFDKLKAKLAPVSIVHPFTSIAADVKLGAGTVVLAGTTVNAGTTIGDNCIINSHSLIDHDCMIGNHVHVGQSVTLGSGNRVDASTHLEQGKIVDSAFY